MDTIIAKNKLIDAFLGLKSEAKYRKSGKFDINGVEIEEGSIINADGYNSHLEDLHFHVVIFDEGEFGSDIYSDFESLSRYKKIEVIGHCRDYIEVYKNKEWSGNLGMAIKLEDEFVSNDYSKDWNLFMKAWRHALTTIGTAVAGTDLSTHYQFLKDSICHAIITVDIERSFNELADLLVWFSKETK